MPCASSPPPPLPSIFYQSPALTPPIMCVACSSPTTQFMPLPIQYMSPMLPPPMQYKPMSKIMASPPIMPPSARIWSSYVMPSPIAYLFKQSALPQLNLSPTPMISNPPMNSPSPSLLQLNPPLLPSAENTQCCPEQLCIKLTIELESDPLTLAAPFQLLPACNKQKRHDSVSKKNEYTKICVCLRSIKEENHIMRDAPHKILVHNSNSNGLYFNNNFKKL